MIDIVTIETTCPVCRKSHEVEVFAHDYFDWHNGVHTQDAFPYLTDAQRELLISGIDEKCWNDIFNEEEEEE